MGNKKLKAYFASDVDESEGGSFVAENCKEAKQMAFNHETVQDVEWIDLRIKWLKDAKVEGLKKGFVDFNEGLKRNIYSWTEGDCPICGEEGLIYGEDGKVGCDKCLYGEE